MIQTVNEGILQLDSAQNTRSVGIYRRKILPQLGVSSNGRVRKVPRTMLVRMGVGMGVGTVDVVGVTVVGHLL